MAQFRLSEEVEKWKSLLASCHKHVEQFWGLDMPVAPNTVHRAWLDKFEELNEERSCGSSLTDLLYVIRCYLLMAANPAKVDEMDISLERLHSLYTRVRLIGVSNTMESRRAETYPSRQEIEQIELEVAAYIVFEFSRGAKEILQALEQKECSSDKIETALISKAEEARSLRFQPPVKKAITDGVVKAAPNAEQLEPGVWWLTGNQALVHNFVPICSRVFHKIHHDAEWLSRMQPRPAPDITTGRFTRARLHQWLVNRLRMQTTNDFYLTLRNTVFETSLPMNTSRAGTSRKSGRSSKVTSPLALLEQECGFQALSRVNSVLDAEFSVIAADEKHELHQAFLLVMFHFQLHQACKVKFIGQFYLSGQRAGHGPELSELMTKTHWGMNRRPLLVELERSMYLCDVSGSDKFARGSEEEKEKCVERVPCRDMYDGLLYWLLKMHDKYNSELICSTDIKRFIDQF